MRLTEGRVALAGLGALSIWLFLVLPCLYSSSCQERLMETKDLLTGLATILLAGVTYLLFHAKKWHGAIRDGRQSRA